MMNGVEILASAEVAAESVYNITAFWVVVSVGCIITAIMCACVWAEEGFSGCIVGIACIGVLISFFVGGAAAIGCSTLTAYVTEYKVIISDEVSMNEFMDNYEILDREGKIYTIRERELEEPVS